jgi:hypothetical protein
MPQKDKELVAISSLVVVIPEKSRIDAALVAILSLVDEMKKMRLAKSHKTLPVHGWAHDSQLAILGRKCALFLGQTCFDSTAPVDKILDGNGKISERLYPITEEEYEEYEDDFESDSDSQSSEIPGLIRPDVYDPASDWDLFPSDVVHVPNGDGGPEAWVPFQFSNLQVSQAAQDAQAAQAAQDSECHETISNVQRMMADLQVVADTMMHFTISFHNILSAVAKSGNFDLDVVQTFFEEFVILLETIFTIDVDNELPVSWSFFKELAILQSDLFKMYTMAESYNYANELIWHLSNKTEFQKEFLQKCILDSVGFEAVMLEIGDALKSMLSLQDEFIVKLIARLQASKNDQDSGTLKWVAV